MHGTQRLSTLDFAGGRFLLLAGLQANAWCDAAHEEANQLGIRLTCERIAEHGALGIGRDGAALVRPDGIVAWRSRGSAPKESLARALRQILGMTEV
ncbi:hypothetical protein [Hydrogenophaga sp.]|uniref:aromatic-ring hydroxylase C-terminal domain-containing protein n=1 Tax=Hydrogenophaga sp. TaxID=1904254 RepID=UPI00345BDD49